MKKNRKWLVCLAARPTLLKYTIGVRRPFVSTTRRALYDIRNYLPERPPPLRVSRRLTRQFFDRSISRDFRRWSRQRIFVAQ